MMSTASLINYYLYPQINPMALAPILLLGSAIMSCNPQVMCTVSESVELPVFQPGYLDPVDSTTHLKVGQKAPDFTLPSLSGKRIRLSDLYRESVVVITFV